MKPELPESQQTQCPCPGSTLRTAVTVGTPGHHPRPPIESPGEGGGDPEGPICVFKPLPRWETESAKPHQPRTGELERDCHSGAGISQESSGSPARVSDRGVSRRDRCQATVESEGAVGERSRTLRNQITHVSRETCPFNIVSCSAPALGHFCPTQSGGSDRVRGEKE